MLIRFGVENFKSFNKKQELVMIPSNRIQKHVDHIITIGDISLLRNATIYGANASGKTNTIEAMKFAKYVITKKIPSIAKNMYCRNCPENKNKETKFEFELHKNNKFYAYGFSLNMSDQMITSEWLYELLPKNKSQQMLFERETNSKRIELGESVKLDHTDEMRFETYKLDFEDNTSTLFINEMNRNKKIKANSKLSFFKDVFEWFDDDLITIFPDQPITDFGYFYGDSKSSKVDEIIKLFDTGISKVKIENLSMADFKNKIPESLADNIINTFREKQEENNNDEVTISFRVRTSFYNIKGKFSEEPQITTIMLEHENTSSDFEFSEESDGTRRLFDLLDILISCQKNKIYVIDELDRSLHPKVTYKFLELFFELLKENNIQLIFTTHESTIMDQELLRRDEIWFVERTNENDSKLFSLDRFKERYDKILSKAYLDGRYGAIPVFKEFSYEECE